MKIQHALIPHKHVRFGDSLLALAGYVRTILHTPYNIDELWHKVQRDYPEWMQEPSFMQLVYAIDILYALQIIELQDDNRIKVVNR